MTFVGKLLIFVNLMLSVVFLALALAIYTQRLNWNTYTPEDGEKVVGKIEQLAKQIKMAEGARDLAENRYYAAVRNVQATEGLRLMRQAWYADMLSSVRTGETVDKKPVVPAVRALTEPAKRNILGLIEATPLNQRAEPLKINDREYSKSMTEYHREFESKVKQLYEAQAMVKKLIAEQKDLTIKLNGRPEDTGMPAIKGLRQLVAEQEEFIHGLRSEQEYLQPFSANYRAEAQLLLKRQSSLMARFRELSGGGVATGR